ncbi:MAG TPA: MFS transporter [Candidatus Limnocylindrales bacterium]|nr:MFS transporter [Candidatus Limnocylindrales bacterium]
MVASVFVAETGVGSILPILPLYLRDRGTSFTLVGIVVGASLVAQGAGQWPAGWLSDRLGRRALMVGGLCASAIASFLFIVPMPVSMLVALRVVQGLGFAAAMPAQRAAVADLVPPSELGVAYGWLSGARICGLIVGPALGGLLAVFGRWTVFAVTGGALLAGAAVAMATLPPMTVESRRAAADELARPLRAGRAGEAMRAVLAITIGIGFLIGIYDVVWSLYMRAIGATDWQVGLSFSLFSVPWVVVTPLAGWISDRRDRRWLAAGSVTVGACFGPVYPLLRNIPLVLIIGAIEAATWAFTEPALNAYIMDAVPVDARGQAQGTVGMAQGLAMAHGAAIAGALFAGGIWVPFVVGAVGCLVLALVSVPWFRAAGEHRRPSGLAVAVE